jgi:acyl-CoA dehydrogenase
MEVLKICLCDAATNFPESDEIDISIVMTAPAHRDSLHQRGMPKLSFVYSQVRFSVSQDWARQSSTFGEKLFQLQVVRHKLMDVLLRTDTVPRHLRELTYINKHCISDLAQMVVRIAMAKVITTQVMQFFTDQVLQILSGMGYLRANKSAPIYPEAKLIMIAGEIEEILNDLVMRQMGICIDCEKGGPFERNYSRPSR